MARTKTSTSSKNPKQDDQDRAAQRARENQQVIIYMFVSLMIIIAWLVGCCQGSFLWVCLLILVTFGVWWSKVMSLIEAHIRDKELQIHRKRALRKSETAEWLNFLLNRWWIFSSSTISDIIKRKLDPLLLDVKPSFLRGIEVVSFTLGEKTPFIKYVDVFEYIDVDLVGKKMMSSSRGIQSANSLVRAQQHQIIIEADVGLVGEDFAMVIRANMGGKRHGVAVDLAVEKLNISGKMQIIVHFDMDMAFPHVTAVTVSFMEKPQIWFSVRALKMLPVTEIPGLKSWIHWLVMNALTEAMVDPGKVNIKFDATGPSSLPAKSATDCNACGVLTVTLKGEESTSGMLIEDIRYCQLSIGDQCKQTNYRRSSGAWQDHCSFLVYDLTKDKLHITSMSKVLFTTRTHAEFVVPLADFPFECTPIGTMTLEDNSPKAGTPVSLQLEMEYTALTPIDILIDKTPQQISEVSGVMYVCIHGARNLLGLDMDGFSDPYCVLYNNGKKVLSTHYVKHTRNPDWNVTTEFTVADVTKTMLSFIICDWDGHSASEDDLLGSAHAILTKDEPKLIRAQLKLGYNALTQSNDAKLGSVIVSLIFRPVPSVAKSEMVSSTISNTEDVKAVKLGNFQPKDKSKRSKKKKVSSSDHTVHEILGYNLLEIHIIRAKNLVAKDMNGYSDPYVVVSINDERKYKSNVKKKTLDPVWDEHVTLPLLKEDDILEVTVWDRDPLFLKDFLGSLTFTLDDLKKYNNNNQHDGWFVLNRIEKGELQLKISFPLDDTHTERMERPQMVDVSTSMSCIAGSPDSGLPSSTPVTPMMNNAFTFLNQNGLPHTVSNFTNQLSNAVTRQRSMSLPGYAETPQDRCIVVGEEMMDSSPRSGVRQRHTHSRSTSAPSAKGTPKSPNLSCVKSKLWRHSFRHTRSLDPMVLTGDKTESPVEFYHVQGQVHRIKGLSDKEQDFYIKIRLDKRFFGKGRSSTVIAKSAKVKATSDALINLKFEVDSGVGVSKEAFLTFDVKKSRKSHIATQSFVLQEIFGESEKVTKWLHLDASIELELTMQHTLIPLPRSHKLRSAFSSFRASNRSSHT